jgi:CubicO group peptidase (beta-lactamase class C family)
MKINMNNKIMANILLSLSLLCIALAITTVANAKPNNKEIKDRLETLSLQLEKKRQEFHIPGMAIAIVKDNKMIFSKGFGVSNLETKKKVTDKTVFGIGSTTKAFTATLIGMMADEDKIKWDDPVTKHLPYLDFNLENESDEITIRDMISHQTGFTRFNLLYSNGKVGREEILKAATKAEPYDGFRKNFHYTNLMVSAAGVASAKSNNTDWDSLLEKRLLKPLGMKNTTSRYDVAQKNKRLSNGYMWLEEQNKHKQLDMHNITNIGPAGAINSNVKDMAKWIQLQLGNGVYKGQRIVSETQILETRTPQIKMGPGANYGLGWMLREYKGQKMVAHDGSVEGYSAIVAMLPESNMGFVILTNVTYTGLLGASVSMVWDTLLNEKQNEKNTQAQAITTETKDTSYETYVGEYIANFGSFQDTIFKFHLKEGVAYVDVPGQTDYELKAPDKEGKMFFAVTDTVSVSFDKNAQGQVSALRMQQGGMNFELPKKGVPVIAEIDAIKLQKYLGKYTSELFKGEINVIINNHRLTVDVPGEMAFELHLPDANGQRLFRVKDSMSVAFESDDDNRVKAISVYKSGNKIDTAQRIKTVQTESLPTIADILKLRKTKQSKKAFLNSKGYHLKGQMKMKQSGVTGIVNMRFQGYENFIEEVDFGKYGSVATALNAESGAIAPSFAAFMEQHGKYFQQLQRLHPAALIDWEYFYDKIQVESLGQFNDREVYIIKLSSGKLPSSKLYVDVQNGDILKQETNLLNPTVGSIPVTLVYENYKDIYGLRLPYKVTTKNEFNGTTVVELDSVESNLTIDPSIFILNNPESGE